MLFMEEADAARRRKREKPESDSESDIICKVLEGVRLVNYEFAIKKEKSQKSKIKRKHKKSKDKRKKKTRLRDTSSPQNVVKGFSESMNQSRRSKVCQDLICQKNICSK